MVDIVIVCRAVKDGLKDGYTVGHNCCYCAEPVQISSGGITQLQEHPAARVLCNPCGLRYNSVLEAIGGNVSFKLSHEAKRELDAGNNSPLADWLRRRIS